MGAQRPNTRARPRDGSCSHRFAGQRSHADPEHGRRYGRFRPGSARRARIDKTRKVLTASVLPARKPSLVKVGQRVRALSAESKSSMYQAYVTRVARQGDRRRRRSDARCNGRARTATHLRDGNRRRTGPVPVGSQRGDHRRRRQARRLRAAAARAVRAAGDPDRHPGRAVHRRCSAA